MQKISVIIFMVVQIIFECEGYSIKDFMHRVKRDTETPMSKHLHPLKFDDYKNSLKIDNAEEMESDFWIEEAQRTLHEQLNKKINTNIAKNVIIFLGDGMSVATITAARIYAAQKLNQPGEESSLFFEQFPYLGHSKTYCVDKQTADSACSSTAYLTGVKGNYATIGVNGKVRLNDCKASLDKKNHARSIMSWAQDAKKATGIVTTTRVTHASPAGSYSHVANRDYECDADMLQFPNIEDCMGHDIATQLIRNKPGRNFNVIYGGGRKKFISKNIIDDKGVRGERLDNLDLIDEWLEKKRSPAYISDRKSLLSMNHSATENVLGLFAASHLDYHLEENQQEPSLAEMTKSAIEILSKNKNGFVLFVEGGKIDLAHHFNLARHALEETEELAEAVKTATEMTDEEDTLIVVTADHSHTFTLSGYSTRGEDILGKNTEKFDNNGEYLTVNYANGPSGGKPLKHNFDEKEIKNINFQFPSQVPLEYETHGSEDVPIYARGPFSHLFCNTIEQNVIPHIIAYAACIGNKMTACNEKK